MCLVSSAVVVVVAGRQHGFAGAFFSGFESPGSWDGRVFGVRDCKAFSKSRRVIRADSVQIRGN